MTTALLFAIWKSPYSQGFIDFFSQNLYTITRMVDFSDLVALLVLPLGFFYVPSHSVKISLNPLPIACLNKIAGTIGLPIVVFTVAKLISSVIPDSFESFLFARLGEAIMVYIVTAPLFMLIFYFLKLRSRFDIVFHILLFSLGVVFIEEWLYLRNILF